MTILRTRAEAIDMTDDEAGRVWDAMQVSPFRKLVEFELQNKVHFELTKLMKFDTPGQFFKQQGIVEGLNIAIGVLSRADHQPHGH